jgi:hypothetical protein
MSGDFVSIETVSDLEEGCLDIVEDSLVKRASTPQPVGFRARFDVLPSPKFNAYAWQERPGVRPRYAVTRGALLAILDLCMEIAADPSFLPEAGGDAERLDAEVPPGVVRFLAYPVEDPRRPAVDFLGVVPRDPRRQAVGWSVFDFAARFVAMHEQAHYLNGHVRLVQGGRLFEMADPAEPESDAPAPAVTPEDRRAFELEADAFSYHNAALLPALRWEEYRLKHAREGFQPTRPDWCMLSFLGAALVGLLMSGRAPQATAESRHPSPACRLLGLMHGTRQVRRRLAESAGENLDDEWEAAIPRAFAGLQTAVNALSATTAEGLRDLLAAFTEDTPHPAREEYARLGQVLARNRGRLAQAHREIAPEIGGSLLPEGP